MKTILILSAAVLLAVATSKSHFMHRKSEVENRAIVPLAIPASVEPSDEAGPEVKLVLLALMPEGFDSKELQLDSGEYLFVVGNRTGLKEVSVRLDREGNERLAAAVVGGRQRDWKKRLKLAIGVYVITANDNPSWTCRIVVGR